MSGFLNPPLPTDAGGVPSQDFESTADNYDKNQLENLLKLLSINIPGLGVLIAAIGSASHGIETAWSIAGEVLKDVLLGLFKIDSVFGLAWLQLETALFETLFVPVQKLDLTVHEHLLSLLAEALEGQPGSEVTFGSGVLATAVQAMYNQMVQPFTLLGSTLNPKDLGTGLKHQQYLLSTGLNLALQEKVIDDLGNHFGLGILKTLGSYMQIIDQSINPRNVVRQAMDSSYALLLKAPLTRDLNHAYPIKNLGVTALAHLYIRGTIDQATYFDRCLDAGLDNNAALELVLESSKTLSPGNISDLLQHGFITPNDAQQLLLQQGYQSASVDALMYLNTHSRYFAIQERVGTAAVSAWRAGKLDQPTMESILRQTGFNPDEIQLLELEAAFAKSQGIGVLAGGTTVEPRSLSYSQVKNMFEANLIGIDEVIAYLQNENYAPNDVMNLVLLDFTEAAQRQARQAALIARLRVQANQQQVTALVDAKKNETALAAARNTLADELNAEANVLGTLQTIPAIVALAGLIP